jgi:hypothetical protein
VTYHIPATTADYTGMGGARSKPVGLWHEPGLDDALGMAVALAHVVDAVHSAEDLVPALTDAAGIAARGLGFATVTLNLARRRTTTSRSSWWMGRRRRRRR